MSASEETFPALRRQIAYRGGFYNEDGLETDLETAEALLAVCKDMRLILLGITPMRAGAVLATDAAWNAILKAEGRKQ